MTLAWSLLQEADGMLTPELLKSAANSKNFASGASWMKQMLSHIRQSDSGFDESTRDTFVRAGFFKYGAAIFFAFLCAAAIYLLQSLLAPLGFLFGFYLAEAQFVFLFPCMLDKKKQPASCSRELVLQAGGSLPVMFTIMQIAFLMLFGGFLGRGFVRSWAQGCAAVAIWYQHLLEHPSKVAKATPLDFWKYKRLEIRNEEIYSSFIPTEKTVRIALLSDLHFGSKSSSEMTQLLISKIQAIAPDLLLIAGDLLENESGFALLEDFLSKLPKKFPWAACAGNHDQRSNCAELEKRIYQHGGHWLPARILSTTLNNLPLEVASSENDFSESATFRILCTHYPKKLDPDKSLAQLIVAGHLHGSQIVLWKYKQLLFPGKLFFRWNGLRFNFQNSTVIMSNGIGDTLPIRWNCPPEIVVCTLRSA